jgi:hypothetical protein
MRGPVGIDRPDDPDVPSDKPSDHPTHRAQPETRNREEYYADLRTAVAVQERTEPVPPSESDARTEPVKQTENDPQAQLGSNWEETAELSRWMWSEYKRRWPPEERPPVDRSNDPPGSWRGDVVRFLPTAVNAELERECDHIASRERETISPDLRELESRDPNRRLIGFDHRIKDRDRIKEKVYDDMDLLGRSPHDAIALIPDTIRYTFQYDEARYTQSVRADIAHMEERGFKLNRLKNYWSDDQYKGINSQWIEPNSGQRFEVQFHSHISFEAKQITHGSYERLRTHQADALEELVLEAFQRKVAAAVPVPSGATEIPDYREGEQHAR